MILDDDKSNPEMKFRLILTKSFEFNLPSSILNQSMIISFDVIDIIAHNSIQTNKKISVDTSLLTPETFIFNCKQFTHKYCHILNILHIFS
jgi:hypothetical protein